MIDPFDKHRPGIRRRVTRIMRMIEAGRVGAAAPVVAPEDGAGGGDVAKNREGASTGRFRRVALDASLEDLIAQATTALPPKREPRSMVLDSDDLMPPIKAPWISRVPFDPWVNSATFGQDSPEALRASGPQAVASALAGLAEWGAACGRQDVREVAALIRTWLVEDAGKHDTLDRDIGLSPRDGRRPLSDVARRAERDELVILLSRQKPYADMGAREAAKRLRAVRERYETDRWPRDREERATRPAGEAETWWHVMRLGLARPMPDLERLVAMIETDRGSDQLRLPLLS